MADYRELLRRAVDSLPENNGASRRQVYEKARAALVTQLRAINPPLPAREITQHRLQLEDCVREVEQEATDVLLAGLKKHEEIAPEGLNLSVAASVEEAADALVDEAEEPVPEVAGVAVEAELEDVEAALEEIDAQEAIAQPIEEPEVEEPEVEEVSAPIEVAEVEAELESPTLSEPEPEPEPEVEPKPEVESESEIESEAEAETALKAEPEIVSEAEDVAETDEFPEDLIEDLVEDVAVEEPEEDDRLDEHDPFAAAFAEKAPVQEDVPQTVASETVIALDGSVPSAQAPAPKLQPGSIEFIIAQAQAAAEQAAISTRWKSDAIASGLTEPDVVEVDAREIEALEKERTAVNAVALAAASEIIVSPVAEPAMSQVREVEVEVEAPELAPQLEAAAIETSKPATGADPQVAIDRAIETLDREARGENTNDAGSEAEALLADQADANGDGKARGGSALTIFLVLFVLLLAGVGGGGYWAWREGFIDLDSLFGNGDTVVAEVVTSEPDVAPSDNAGNESVEAATGPGNTTATPDAVEVASEELADGEAPIAADDTLAELQPRTVGAAAVVEETPRIIDDSEKSEERLPTEDQLPSETSVVANADGSEAALGAGEVAVEPTVVPLGGQSLLLEASSQGTTGAVPFSGTVDWSRGVDELGLPTLLATANIPARNLGVNVLIRLNSDAALPASHIMEINFEVSETFAGGSIASLPGVLLKNEELSQGTLLEGASARVLGNSFLFALSASDQAVASNTDLLKSRKWMDLALIYADGKHAIITLEKDDNAQAMFDEVLAIWSAQAAVQ